MQRLLRGAGGHGWARTRQHMLQPLILAVHLPAAVCVSLLLANHKRSPPGLTTAGQSGKASINACGETLSVTCQLTHLLLPNPQCKATCPLLPNIYSFIMRHSQRTLHFGKQPTLHLPPQRGLLILYLTGLICCCSLCSFPAPQRHPPWLFPQGAWTDCSLRPRVVQGRHRT